MLCLPGNYRFEDLDRLGWLALVLEILFSAATQNSRSRPSGLPAASHRRLASAEICSWVGAVFCSVIVFVAMGPDYSRREAGKKMGSGPEAALLAISPGAEGAMPRKPGFQEGLLPRKSG